VGYNLAKFLPHPVLPRLIQGWTLTTLREKPIKIGAKVIAQARYVTFQLAEVADPRRLFAHILERIARLCPCASVRFRPLQQPGPNVVAGSSQCARRAEFGGLAR
jgi:hypothetical protein